MTLKTLKDVCYGYAYTAVKAEAIKCIKKEDLIIADWRTAFKWFFNITESDLNNEEDLK